MIRKMILQGYYDSLRETDEDDNNKEREDYEEMRAEMEMDEMRLRDE